MILGEKYWYIAVDELPMPGAGHAGYETESLKWQCVVLRPQDDL